MLAGRNALFHADGVRADLQLRDGVFAVGVGWRCEVEASLSIGEHNLRAGNDSAGRVTDSSRNRAPLGLCKQCCRE